MRPYKYRDPFYLHPKWKETRLKVLRRDRYICQECGVKCLGKAKGCPSPEVDHIIPKSESPHLAHSLSNLRTLCKSCHSKRTMLDNHGKKKPLIGPDGFPVEEISA